MTGNLKHFLMLTSHFQPNNLVIRKYWAYVNLDIVLYCITGYLETVYTFRLAGKLPTRVCDVRLYDVC